MDLIYTVSRKHSAKSLQDYECFHEGDTVCSVSSQNIIAFSTSTQLEDASGKTWGSHVYVADLNMPWDAHRVVSNRAAVTVLEWDLPGQKLLICDAVGAVQVWTFKDYLLNDWVCIGTANFTGEYLLAAAFFHHGKKISLVSEKKDNTSYSEKFSHQRFAASVRHFGGRPVEGCLVISSTGMVGVVGIHPLQTGHYGIGLTSTSDSLGTTRTHISTADICYGKNGHFLVAVSSGNVNLPVQCYRVSVTKTEEKFVTTSQALPSFFLECSPSKDGKSMADRTVTKLKFVVREDADTLVVAANGEKSCHVEVWELRERPVNIHNIFQQQRIDPNQPKNVQERPKTVLWQHQSHFTGNAPLSCLATSKVFITTVTPPPSYVLVALADGHVHCLYRDALKVMATTSVNSLSMMSEQPVSKHPRLGVRISHMDLSWLGNIVVAADTQGQLYLYRLPPILEPGGPMTVPSACTLLEYCLVTGMDWWDLLLTIRLSMLEPVCERFSESFLRQLPALQQYHYAQFLSIRTSLYRLSVSGQSKAADLTSLMMLHSVATAFKSLLRPSDLSSHDKGPAESLTALMCDAHTDVDKVLLNLEAKEFTMEKSTLQSLQQLIQWVADLALVLLSRLPHGTKPSGYDILRDKKALNTLRELLALIRMWGLLQSSCLPVFTRSADNLDVLSLLFKLLSRLVQLTDPDDALLDDCLSLPSQVLIPQLHVLAPTTMVASPPLGSCSLPLQLEFGVEPDILHFVPDVNVVEGINHTEQIVDSIRHIYLGKQPLTVKQCCRCGARAMMQGMSRSVAMNAWDQRWAKACRCGGHWRIKLTA